MKTLLALVIIVALGFGAYMYLRKDQGRTDLERVEDRTIERAQQATETVRDKLKDLSLSSSDIKEELERSGKVVRKKAEQVGSVIADATADARITGVIKAKLVQDPTLSALRISVNTTDGVVTLSGSVAGPEEIKQAMKLALETEGVREAISTLQVKATK